MMVSIQKLITQERILLNGTLNYYTSKINQIRAMNKTLLFSINCVVKVPGKEFG